MVQAIENEQRGTWCMVKCYQKETPEKTETGNFKKMKDQRLVPSQNCGYIIFKDKNICMFYTDALTGTMTKDTLMGDEQEACMLVHGLSPIRRWTDESVSRRSTLMVPCLIVHYNMYMCAVDKVDLHRSMCVTQRKEKRGIMAFLLSV